MNSPEIHRIQSLFTIDTILVQQHLQIKHYQTILHQIQSCDNPNNRIKLPLFTMSANASWDILRVKLFVCYYLANSGNDAQALEFMSAMLVKYSAFYQNTSEYQVFMLLNQYLICKYNIHSSDIRELFKELFKLIIWKYTHLHYIIRTIIGYVLIVKLNRKSNNIQQPFQQAHQLIMELYNINTDSMYQCITKEDMKQFIHYWHKVVMFCQLTSDHNNEFTKLETLLKIDKTINGAIKYFKDQQYFKQLQLNINKDMALLNLTKPIVQTIPTSIPTVPTKVNNFVIDNLNKSKQIPFDFLPKYSNYDSAQRIKTLQPTTISASIHKQQITKSNVDINSDPIFQQQIENYYISKLVKKGCFKIKGNVNLSTYNTQRDTNTRRILQTQPTMDEAMPILLNEQTQQSFDKQQTERSEELEPIVLTVKESIHKQQYQQQQQQQSSGQLPMPMPLERKPSEMNNPFKLKNLVNSRFHQILELGMQSSVTSTPLIQRQKGTFTKEYHDYIKQFDEETVETNKTTKPKMNYLTSQNNQNTNNNGQPRNTSRKRLSRRVLCQLKYTRSQIYQEKGQFNCPNQEFIFIYFERIVEWEMKVQVISQNQYNVFFIDLTNNKLVHKITLSYDEQQGSIKWQQVSQQIAKQFHQQLHQQIQYLDYNYNQCSKTSNEYSDVSAEDMNEVGVLKDVFRWLYTTYLYEERNINGCPLKLNGIKDSILNASRELLNVLRFYRRQVFRQLINCKCSEYSLVMRNMTDTLNGNIKLLNQILNLRFLKQKNQMFLVHKQLVYLNQLSLNPDVAEKQFAIITVHVKTSQDNILYLHKSSFRVKPTIQVIFSAVGQNVQLEPLILQFEIILKILDIEQSSTQLLNLVCGIIFQQRKSYQLFQDFISHKLMINDQKSLAVKMNLFSLKDAQKMEACGMKMGFIIDLKTKVKPYAITQLEQYIMEDLDKQIKDEQTSELLHYRDHLFDDNFNQIIGENQTQQDNKQVQYQLKPSLYQYSKKQQCEDNDNHRDDVIRKVGKIQIHQENPFVDQHPDEIEQVFVKNLYNQSINNNTNYSRIKHYRILQATMSIEYNAKINCMIAKFHQGNRLQRFAIKQNDEEEDILQKIQVSLKNAPIQWYIKCLYKKLSQRVLKNSFRNTVQYDGFDLLKQIKCKSELAEVPPYSILHYKLLNNPNYLLRYFNEKQFILIQKIKHYGKYQIIIRIFYRFMKPDVLSDNDYLLYRLDFQDINSKIGMSKIIVNRYDIVDVLKIPMASTITDKVLVNTAISIFQIMYMCQNHFNKVPFFASPAKLILEQQTGTQDYSETPKVQRIRRISNIPDNFTFKKADTCKGFLEHYIKHSRLVLTQTRRLYLVVHAVYGQVIKISSKHKPQLMHDQHLVYEYTIVQIYRHLLIDQWMVLIYIPKTTRQVTAILTRSDFTDLDDISELLQLKYKSHIENNQLSHIKTFKQFQEYRDNQTQIVKRYSTMRSSIASQLRNVHIRSVLEDLFELTDKISEITEYQLEEDTIKLMQYLEKHIWMLLISNKFKFEMNSKKQNVFLTLLFGSTEISMNEILFGRYIRIERVGESYIEFYMKYSQQKSATDNLKGFALIKEKIAQMQHSKNREIKVNIPNQAKISGLLQELKYNEEQVRFMKRTSVFFAFDSISYANSSNYNIEMKYYSYNKFTEVSEDINLRELLNLYIADGYYKYQTNYMNSKLNQQDVVNICFYVIHKIKTQNFLNLSQHHLIPNLPLLTSSHIKWEVNKLYHFYQKPYIYTIDILNDVLELTRFDPKNCKTISNKYKVDDLSDRIFAFDILFQEHPYVAIQRLKDCLKIK